MGKKNNLLLFAKCLKMHTAQFYSQKLCEFIHLLISIILCLIPIEIPKSISKRDIAFAHRKLSWVY
jgi:hypothetical protein